MNVISLVALLCALTPCISSIKSSVENDAVLDKNSFKTVLFLDENINILQPGFWGSCRYYDTIGNEHLSNGSCLINQTNSEEHYFDNRLFVFTSPWESELCEIVVGKIGTDTALLNTGLIFIENEIVVLDSKSYFSNDKTIYWGKIEMTLESFAYYVIANVSLETSDSGLDYMDFGMIDRCIYRYLPPHDISEERSVHFYDSVSGIETNLYDRYLLIKRLYESEEKPSKNNLPIFFVIGVVLKIMVLLIIGYYVFAYVWNRKRKKENHI